MLNTPVLLILFKRPETTYKVFESIRKVKPSVLYIAADGPRNREEEKLCIEARKITENIDWDCKVHRLYRVHNLGCKHAVISAINWFFEQEKRGIILEDDCVSDESFFYFCDTMLDNYDGAENIKTISGTNFLFGALEQTDDYFFLNYTMMWGWATWKRAWLEVDWNVPFDKQTIAAKINNTYPNKKFREWIYNATSHYYNNFETITDIWDIHVMTTFLLKDGLSVIPSKNLIKNIGIEGTHSFKDNKSINVSTKKIIIEKLPQKKKAVVSSDIQNIFMRNVVNVWMPKESLIIKFKRKIIKFIR